MNKFVTYTVQEISITESCNLSDVPYEYNELKKYLSSVKKEDYLDICSLGQTYQNKFSEINSLKNTLAELKHSKDMALFQQIELTKPPYYLKMQNFNYKVILVYFMRKFRNVSILKLQDFDKNAKTSFNLDKFHTYFSNGKIVVGTQLDSLLHLINIKKFKFSGEVIENILYETITYGDHTGSIQEFESKVASFAWLHETLYDPDYIYPKEALIAEKLKADLIFVRETGNGSNSQKYMHHLVGLRKAYGKYVIVSQFPLEKDRILSKNSDINISNLHKKLDCSKAIYIKEGKELPKQLNSVDRLKNFFN